VDHFYTVLEFQKWMKLGIFLDVINGLWLGCVIWSTNKWKWIFYSNKNILK
jgi:hypothetical protein